MKSDYDAAGKTSLIAKDMAEVYDGQPYRILNDLADGSIPYEDNSGKLSILLESLSSASGMYMYDTGITAIHINTLLPPPMFPEKCPKGTVSWFMKASTHFSG